jgi:6-phospho-beta-glucosidase
MSAPPSPSSSREATLAILGGSSAFLPSLANVLASDADHLPALEIRLLGRDRARTEVIARYCSELARARGVRQEYVAADTVGEAAAGAGIVVNMVRVGGWEGRHYDETFPLAFGYPGDESIGPGGLSAALRGIPVVMAMAREVVRAAPAAWFINMANPMTMLIAALRAIPGLNTFGLCELPAVTLERAQQLLGRSAPLESRYLGVNHQGFFISLREDGDELLPEFFAALERTPTALEFFKVDASVMRRLRALPLPYLRLYYHTERETAAMRARGGSRARDLDALTQELYREYRRGYRTLPAQLQRRTMPWFDLVLVPAIAALLGGPAARVYVSQVNGDQVPELAREAIVERCCVVDARGAQTAAPMTSGRPDLVDLLARIVRFEGLAVAAALEPTPERILDALRAHPFAIPEDSARAMLPFLTEARGGADRGSGRG